MKPLSRVRLFATPWTIAHQAPPSMGFSRQEYWSGLPFPSPEDLPDRGIKPRSPALQADTLTSEPPKPLTILPSSNHHSLQLYCFLSPITCSSNTPRPPVPRYHLFHLHFLKYSKAQQLQTPNQHATLLLTSPAARSLLNLN